MSEDNKGVTFPLKVMINKEKDKVLFAEADGHFADILITFLTLPLGRILNVLEKHYGDDAPTIGSLSSLYRSIANLDTSRFVTEGAKQTLLNPKSSFEAEYQSLKLDITDSSPPEYFFCRKCFHDDRFRSVSMYYDHADYFKTCSGEMYKVVEKGYEYDDESASGDGVFTMHTAHFIISDDLQILSNETGVFGIVTTLGITDMDEAETVHVDLGFTEIMDLLKASFTSPTPLSDVILNRTTQMNSAIMELPPKIEKEENPNTNTEFLTLKVMVQKSSGKLLYAQANKKFIEFLFSILHIPLGGVVNLLGGKTCFEAINNLCRSTAHLIEGEHFKNSETKKRIMKPNLVHGCISEDPPILPLTEEPLPPYQYDEHNIWRFSCLKFPEGKGSYLHGPRTYQLMDDLSVAPFCFVPFLSSLREQKIPLSDVEQVEKKIGSEEGLSILEAALRSTSALTEALLNRTSNTEPQVGSINF